MAQSSLANAKTNLVCGMCSRTLSSVVDIDDDAFFINGESAYLLKNMDLSGCKRNATEKRSMRTGTYDIDWLNCGCGSKLGFFYSKLYGESLNSNAGKAVIVQSRLGHRQDPAEALVEKELHVEYVFVEDDVEASGNVALEENAKNLLPSPTQGPSSSAEAAGPARESEPDDDGVLIIE